MAKLSYTNFSKAHSLPNSIIFVIHLFFQAVMYSGRSPMTQPTDPVFPKQSPGQDAEKGDDKGQPNMEEGKDVEMISEESHPTEQQQSPHMKEVHICVR